MAGKFARIFLANDLIEKCTICKEYLSVGPVVLIQNKPVCARCPRGEGPQATFYEKLAGYMFFPCKNDIHGCDVMLAWGLVSQHESICKFTPLRCPALSCEEIVEKEHLVKHFNSEHDDLVMNENKFKIPLQSGDVSVCNKLFIWKNIPFIVKIAFSSHSCFLGIEELRGRNLECSFFLEDEEKRTSMIIRGIHVSDYRMKSYDRSKMTKINMDFIREQYCTDKVICTVNIGNVELPKSVLNNNLLTELECPICMDYLAPPIFMCSSGHAICNTCKSKISKCPICQIALNDNKNYALERIAEHISYPCKYHQEGCPTDGQFIDIRLHEAICAVGANLNTACYVSYLETCDWKGPISKLMSHIFEVHPLFFFNLKNFIQLDLKIFKFMTGFLESHSQIFKLLISNDHSKNIRICVVSILDSSKPKEKYRFHVDFEDLNRSKIILSLNKNCSSAPAENDSLIDPLTINVRLFKVLMKNDTISLKINIIRIYF